MLKLKKNCWHINRSSVGTGSPDTDLASGTSMASSVYSSHSSKLVKLSGDETSIELRARLESDGDTCTAQIYAFRKGLTALLPIGDAFHVGQVTFTCGTQEAGSAYAIGSSTGYYADTVVIDSERWLSSLKSSDASGDNKQASVSFLTHGYEYILVLLTSVSANNAAIDVAQFSAF